jgi:cobalt-precorrin 5A hydrolase
MAHRQIMIAAGVGCRTGCSADDIIAALRQASARSGVAVSDVSALYSADFKADEPGLRRAAGLLDKPLWLLSGSALAAHSAGALTASSAVARRFDLPSVAETSALAGAFELGERRTSVRLLAARAVVGGAACALALSELES